NANHISMMKLAAEIIAELEPESMNKIDVFRPKPWWMRPKIHENRWTLRRNDLQRERMAGLGQRLPGLTDAACEFFGIHPRGHSGDQARCPQGRCGTHHRIERVDAGHREKLDRFAFF